MCLVYSIVSNDNNFPIKSSMLCMLNHYGLWIFVLHSAIIWNKLHGTHCHLWIIWLHSFSISMHERWMLICCFAQCHLQADSSLDNDFNSNWCPRDIIVFTNISIHWGAVYHCIFYYFYCYKCSWRYLEIWSSPYKMWIPRTWFIVDIYNLCRSGYVIASQIDVSTPFQRNI